MLIDADGELEVEMGSDVVHRDRDISRITMSITRSISRRRGRSGARLLSFCLGF